MNRYRPLEPVGYTEALNILNCGTSEEKLLLPLRAGEYMNSWKDAQEICIRSFESEDPQIRANAALGLSYIARNTGCLEIIWLNLCCSKSLSAMSSTAGELSTQSVILICSWDGTSPKMSLLNISQVPPLTSDSCSSPDTKIFDVKKRNDIRPSIT